MELAFLTLSQDLIWSGAHLFPSRSTFDFKVANYNGSSYLTFIVHVDENANADPAGAGIILDSSYNLLSHVTSTSGQGKLNMHEFSIINGGKNALMITYVSQFVNLADPGEEEAIGWIGNGGFAEVELATGNVLFEWRALDHVRPSESQIRRPRLPNKMSQTWDYIHINSVDKNADGDYLVSARYTSTIYKISGVDGSIIWRLGGSRNSFGIKGFSFSSQHDARFIDQEGDTTVISLLDNASDDTIATADRSSAMVVALQDKEEPMRASLISKWGRPDRRLSQLRGNCQILPNNNAFVGWSDNSYMSEHTSSGRLVLEAQFASHRFVTYRSFKFNFTGNPQELPTLKAFAYGTSPATSTTVYYVSWNGATEVAAWDFYGSRTSQELVLQGSAVRRGFETSFMSDGYLNRVYAQALDANGNSLGKSLMVDTVAPGMWDEDPQDVHNYPVINEPNPDIPTGGEESTLPQKNTEGHNIDIGFGSVNLAPSTIFLVLTCIIILVAALGWGCIRLCRGPISRPWMKSSYQPVRT